MINNQITTALNHLSKHDKVLSTLIKIIGTCNLQPHKKYFNLLLRSIIGQQLSLKAAESISKKFFALYIKDPQPIDIINSKDTDLRAAGLSNAKVKYIKDLSQKIINGDVDLRGLSVKSDADIIEELTKVKGIGIWTVHMFLIFTLGRIDILPYSDLGIRKAVMLNYGLRKLPDEKKLRKMAKEKNWHPYCSIVSLYMWKSLDAEFESLL